MYDQTAAQYRLLLNGTQVQQVSEQLSCFLRLVNGRHALHTCALPARPLPALHRSTRRVAVRCAVLPSSTFVFAWRTFGCGTLTHSCSTMFSFGLFFATNERPGCVRYAPCWRRHLAVRLLALRQQYAHALCRPLPCYVEPAVKCCGWAGSRVHFALTRCSCDCDPICSLPSAGG